MKGIILAGGTGSRLYPATISISKQLLPVYDKPMIYYPLSVLMLADIREILIITTPQDINLFKTLLGDGKQFGVNLSYEIQEKPEGLAQAFIIGEKFINNSSVSLILGDNLFCGEGFTKVLKPIKQGAHLYAYQVSDPENFGIIEFDSNFNPISIEEKPKKPKSKWALTGLYFYDNQVVNIAKDVEPSLRGELEISSINQKYLELKQLSVSTLGRGFAWLDTGTHENLIEASQFIHTIEKRQGYKIACLEEIALNKQWITQAELAKQIHYMGNSSYSEYLKQFL